MEYTQVRNKPRLIQIPFVCILAILFCLTAACSAPKEREQKEAMTEEEYARQYVDDVIRELESVEWTEYQITDSKITQLEKLDEFDDLLTYRVALWGLSYRLQPDDIGKVLLARGMNEEDGWITEDSSMGKPVLIFFYEQSEPAYLGRIWNGINDFSTRAKRETALRVFLEELELLPQETYPGDHILVKFPLSTGETCQLFLSQPVKQGDWGIWCVERWMDGNGTVYHETPETELSAADYYMDLQEQCDSGHTPSLMDPLQMALDFINRKLGQNVSLDELTSHYSAAVEDFLETPESTFFGTIKNFSAEEGFFHLYRAEWLTLEDTERLAELGVDPNDLPNGFYIHELSPYPMWFGISENTQYFIIDQEGDLSHKEVDGETFVSNLERYGEAAPPYWTLTRDGVVQSITEQYIP